MKYVLITGIFLILPIAPENLSTAAMLSFVVFLMMIIGRVPSKQIGLLVTVCVLIVGL
jgi:cell division protein FtsW